MAQRTRHLPEIDVVRTTGFAAVVGLHTLGSVGTGELGTGLGLQLLHFGRETFFILTAFVLTRSAATRPPAPGAGLLRFWRRRFALVGLPYTVWTVLYWLTRLEGRDPWSADALRGLRHSLVMGTGMYHLYFLQVALQAYLLFPLLLLLVLRTRRHHAALLGVAGAVQATYLAVLRWVPAPGGWAQNLWLSPNQLVLTYVFPLLVGAVAACHHEAVLAWVGRHRAAVPAVVGAALALDLGTFAAQVLAGADPVRASEPLQPVSVVWGPAAALGLLALGARLRRGPTPVTAPVTAMVTALAREGARVSFGVYLVHPLVLSVLLGASGWAHGGSAWPLPVVFVLTWVGTLLGSVALVQLLSRLPLAVALTGRPRVRPAPPTPVPT
ncbi:acyltransferase family protein [Kineococcus aurantiacus]|uniref:Peptidoglycan/LPS O-acetylase OafA/YrhL n=1 Tax=Kineococcus aurantiacus TaxID=37633 RepID=A0A7Y9DPJ5_9ACTN|nr:acyltransferase [Kineococcus aurantiacus]NYD24329.1 peptidoglycan/LPS O-acetylase OafA/YrhL [Kineococcus aurantiacus]